MVTEEVINRHTGKTAILDSGWVLLWDSLFSFFHTLHSPPFAPSFCFSSSVSLILSLRPCSTVMTSFPLPREGFFISQSKWFLWWPRYDSQPLHLTVCEGVFNTIISLTSSLFLDVFSSSLVPWRVCKVLLLALLFVGCIEIIHC